MNAYKSSWKHFWGEKNDLLKIGKSCRILSEEGELLIEKTRLGVQFV